MLRKNEEVQNGNGSGNGLGMGLLTRFRELRCFSNCMFVVFSFNDRLLKAGEGEGWTLKVEQISEKSVGGRAISRNGGFFWEWGEFQGDCSLCHVTWLFVFKKPENWQSRTVRLC